MLGTSRILQVNLHCLSNLFHYKLSYFQLRIEIYLTILFLAQYSWLTQLELRDAVLSEQHKLLDTLLQTFIRHELNAQ